MIMQEFRDDNTGFCSGFSIALTWLDNSGECQGLNLNPKPVVSSDPYKNNALEFRVLGLGYSEFSVCCDVTSRCQ